MAEGFTWECGFFFGHFSHLSLAPGSLWLPMHGRNNFLIFLETNLGSCVTLPLFFLGLEGFFFLRLAYKTPNYDFYQCCLAGVFLQQGERLPALTVEAFAKSLAMSVMQGKVFNSPSLVWWGSQLNPGVSAGDGDGCPLEETLWGTCQKMATSSLSQEKTQDATTARELQWVFFSQKQRGKDSKPELTRALLLKCRSFYKPDK